MTEVNSYIFKINYYKLMPNAAGSISRYSSSKETLSLSISPLPVYSEPFVPMIFF
jgi:hypothetical protein